MSMNAGGGKRAGRMSRRFGRKGSAVVEMAVVTPLLLTLVFGVIEFGWVLMVKETLTTATREACRVAILQGSSDQEVRDRFTQAVAPTGLTISSEMLVLSRATQTSPIETVTVTIPRAQVSLVGGYFGNIIPGFANGNIVSTCTMRKEGSI